MSERSGSHTGEGDRGRPAVLVYRNQLLPFSETFLLHQMEALRAFRPYYLGGRVYEGPRLDLPEHRTRFVNRGGRWGVVREGGFKLLGWIPRDVWAWISAVRPRLIHAHFAPDGFVALALARRMGVPLVVSFHGSDITMRDGWVLRQGGWTHKLAVLFRRRMIREVARFVVPSRYMWEVARARGFPEARLRLVRHGIPLKDFARHGPEVPEPGHVVYVGRLIPLKGLPFLIRALGRLRGAGISLRLTVIGDGPERRTYEALAREVLKDAVRFLGIQPPEEVRRTLRRAWVFSMPSVSLPSGQAESFGMVYVEAQALGVPVVAFRVGGVPEVVEHGRTGFLAPEGDEDRLAEYLARILQDPGLRQAMGEAGRRRVARLFDVQRNVRDLEAVYREVLDQRGA